MSYQFLVSLIYLANFCTYFGSFYTTGQILIAVNGQKLEHYLAIWSHWKVGIHTYLPNVMQETSLSSVAHVNCICDLFSFVMSFFQTFVCLPLAVAIAVAAAASNANETERERGWAGGRWQYRRSDFEPRRP